MTRRLEGAELSDALQRVRQVVLDVDGVLTSGRKLYTATGIAGLEFDTRDGLGVALLRAAGCVVALVSNGDSEIVSARAADLFIEIVVLGSTDKASSVELDILPTTGVAWRETLVMGDDIWDVEAMRRAGVAASPCDAHASALAVASFVTESAGGRGSVREVADLVLAAKGLDPIDFLDRV